MVPRYPAAPLPAGGFWKPGLLRILIDKVLVKLIQIYIERINSNFGNLQFVLTSSSVLRSVGEFIKASSLVIGLAHVSPCRVSLIVGDDLLAHVCSIHFPFFLHILKVFG